MIYSEGKIQLKGAVMNQAKIIRWAHILARLTMTRWRVLETVLRAPCLFVLIVALLMSCIMLASLGSIVLMWAKQVFFGTSPGLNLPEMALCTSVLALFFALIALVGYTALELLRVLRFAVYAIIAFAVTLAIRRDFKTSNVSWLAITRVMAIDRLTAQQSENYERFAAMVLTHQLDRDRLSDFERARIDDEIYALQNALYYRRKNEETKKRRALREFDGLNTMGRIEGVYERLQNFDEQSYRLSGVRINIGALYDAHNPFEKLEIGSLNPARRQA